VYLHFGKYF